jgi:hypothetical protein
VVDGGRTVRLPPAGVVEAATAAVVRKETKMRS